jgi:hypothetical protein
VGCSPKPDGLAPPTTYTRNPEARRVRPARGVVAPGDVFGGHERRRRPSPVISGSAVTTPAGARPRSNARWLRCYPTFGGSPLGANPPTGMRPAPQEAVCSPSHPRRNVQMDAAEPRLHWKGWGQRPRQLRGQAEKTPSPRLRPVAPEGVAKCELCAGMAIEIHIIWGKGRSVHVDPHNLPGLVSPTNQASFSALSLAGLVRRQEPHHKGKTRQTWHLSLNLCRE